MTNALTTFTYNTANIRVIDIDGEPWFVAADAANAMRFKNVATSMSHILSPLGSDEKMRSPKKPSLERRPLIISESGLYKLIMRSDKPEARAFQDWVTREVLPSIRKTGSYQAPLAQEQAAPAPEASLSDMIAMDHMIKAMDHAMKAVAAVQAENLTLKAQIADLQ